MAVAFDGHGRQLAREPVREPVTPALTAPVVGEHAPRDAEQPRAGRLALGHITQPPPRHEKGLGDDVGRIGGLVDAPQRVPEHQPPVRVEQRPEAALGL